MNKHYDKVPYVMVCLLVSGILGIALVGTYSSNNTPPLKAPVSQPVPPNAGRTVSPSTVQSVDFNFLNEVVRTNSLLLKARRSDLGLRRFVKWKMKSREFCPNGTTLGAVIAGSDEKLREEMRKRVLIDGLLYYFRESALKAKPSDLKTLDAVYTEIGRFAPDWQKRHTLLCQKCLAGDRGNGFVTLMGKCKERVDKLTAKPLKSATQRQARSQLQEKPRPLDETENTVPVSPLDREAQDR